MRIAWGAPMSVGDIVEAFNDVESMPMNSFRPASPAMKMEDLESV